MKAYLVDKMNDMYENGKTKEEIAKALNISINSVNNKVPDKGRYGDFLGQFDCCVANRLIRAGIYTKEELYDLVSKHGFIRQIGPKLVEQLNEALDRKISLMPVEVIIHWGSRYKETVRRLKFADEKNEDVWESLSRGE